MKWLSAIAAAIAGLAAMAGAAVDATVPAPLIQGHVRAVALDAAGNRYEAGFFFGDVDFNPEAGLDARTSAGDADLFVTRFNADGSYAWTRTFGGMGADAASAVAVAKMTVYVAGQFASSDAGVPNAGGADAIVLAFKAATGAPRSSFGNAGAQTFGGAGEDVATALALAGETLYVAGGFASGNATVGGKGSFASGGGEDGFVLALNAGNGGRVTAFGRKGVQTLTGESVERVTGLALAGQTLFACGYTFAIATGIGVPGTVSGLGGLDAFVMALNRKTGAPSKRFGVRGVELVGGTKIDIAYGIAAARGTVYLAGTFESDDAGVGALGGAQSVGGFDAFVAALNAKTGAAYPFFGISGIQTFGGSDDDGAAAITVLGDQLQVAGAFTSDNAGIGRSGTLASGGGGDAFVLALDAFTGGAFDFAPATFGGSNDDGAFAIAAAGEMVFAAGSSFSPDAGLGGSGTLDAQPWNGFLLGLPASANDTPSFDSFDTDGDDFPDEVEAALGTPPTEFILSPAGFEAGPAGPLKVRSLTIKLNFTTPDPARDKMMLRGKAPIPAGFSAAGQPVAVAVGGVVRRFVLDTHGVAATSDGSFTLRVKKVGGHVPAQNASFTATFKRSSMRDQLDDENLTGAATIPKPGEPRSAAVLVLIGGGFFRDDVNLTYTAVTATSGLAVGP